MDRTARLRLIALLVLVAAAVLSAVLVGAPDVEALRDRVDRAGLWGPALYLVTYTAMAMIPSPVSLLTIAGGALFGLPGGTALSLTGAVIAAVASFVVGRLLGRQSVDRLTHGRTARIDSFISDHGFTSVLVVRLVPLFPFTAVNYASGLSGVRLRDYVLGTTIGIVPGSLAYTALGAYGTNPWGLAGALSALLVLVLGGGWWARRLERRPRRTVTGV